MVIDTISDGPPRHVMYAHRGHRDNVRSFSAPYGNIEVISLIIDIRTPAVILVSGF